MQPVFADTHPYRGIEAAFNLLSACRWTRESGMRALRQALQRRQMAYGRYADLPRLPFWIELCRAAALLDDADPPQPTLLVEDWLSWPLRQQAVHLFEAWHQLPGRAALRLDFDDLPGVRLRRRLAELQALGGWDGLDFTPLGAAWYHGLELPPVPDVPPQPWQIQGAPEAPGGAWLLAHYPPDWALLWQLEAYLRPTAPGVYSLDKNALRQAAQNGALPADEVELRRASLPLTLERGLGRWPPAWLLHALAVQPILRLLPGPVLECDQPEELLRLRQNASLRRSLEHLLSPRHAALSPWEAPRLARRLVRMGLINQADLDGILPTLQAGSEAGNEARGRKRFSKAERAYLLCLYLLAEGAEAPLAPPPGLLARLADGLETSLRAGAARQAGRLLNYFFPGRSWLPEDEPPPAPSEDLLHDLQRAIDTQASIDVLYQASGRSAPEYRHLSPLALEQRRGRWYLSAYCHRRRANRLFRLDRLRLLSEPPVRR